MTKDILGSGNCYICHRPLAPLVSICWACGYSQLPNPNAQGDGPAASAGAAPDGPITPDETGSDGKAFARGRLRAQLNARLGQAKADVRARLKKK